MELIAFFGAGITIYCGWISVRNDLRAWQCYRKKSVHSAEKLLSGKIFIQVSDLCSLPCSRL